jgi:hypothetical protein
MTGSRPPAIWSVDSSIGPTEVSDFAQTPLSQQPYLSRGAPGSDWRELGAGARGAMQFVGHAG